MFKLFYDETQQWVTVFAVRDDGNGYPLFLVKINNQWRYISAKHFSE